MGLPNMTSTQSFLVLDPLLPLCPQNFVDKFGVFLTAPPPSCADVKYGSTPKLMGVTSFTMFWGSGVQDIVEE